MEKIYFVLSLILLAIITVVNVESGFRFIDVELITAMAVMMPDIISGLIRDIKWLYRDAKNQKGR